MTSKDPELPAGDRCTRTCAGTSYTSKLRSMVPKKLHRSKAVF